MAGERPDFAVESHLAGITINFQPTEPEHIPAGATLPSQNGSYPSEELSWLEGFRQIVIRAHFQTNDAVHRVAACGQHEDGKAGPLADLPTDIEPVHIGQHQVQHDHVKYLAHLQREAGGTSLGAFDAVSRPAKIVADHLGKADIVVYQQNFLHKNQCLASSAQSSSGTVVGCF